MRTRFSARAARQRRNAIDPSRAGQGLAAAGGRAGRAASGGTGVGGGDRHAFDDADVLPQVRRSSAGAGIRGTRMATARRSSMACREVRRRKGGGRQKARHEPGRRTPRRAGDRAGAAKKAGKTEQAGGAGSAKGGTADASAGRPARRIRTACGCRSSARADWSRRAWTRPYSRRAGACSRRRGTARCASTGGRTPSRTAFP